MILIDELDLLACDIAFWSLGLIDEDYPLDQLGDLSLDLSGKLRAAAIVVLLTKGDIDSFYHNLIRSGRSRHIYLSRLNDHEVHNDHHQSSGRFGALLDTIAAGDFQLANSIIKLSKSEWFKGHEYLDDFCYAQIIHSLMTFDVITINVQHIIEQWENYQEGKLNYRLETCRALIAKDQELFDDSFDMLLLARENDIITNITRGEQEDIQVIAERQIFVEGLALLRIADMRGMKTHSDYRYCPSVARLPMTSPFPGE